MLIEKSPMRWYKWVCLKMGYTPNYSHLVGIMNSKTIGCRGLAYFQTNPNMWFSILSLDNQGIYLKISYLCNWSWQTESTPTISLGLESPSWFQREPNFRTWEEIPLGKSIYQWVDMFFFSNMLLFLWWISPSSKITKFNSQIIYNFKHFLAILKIFIAAFNGQLLGGCSLMKGPGSHQPRAMTDPAGAGNANMTGVFVDGIHGAPLI